MTALSKVLQNIVPDPAKYVNPITITVFIILILINTVLYHFAILTPTLAIGATAIAGLIAYSIKIADQWEKAALEVRRYTVAVYYIAQTCLRDIIGKHELADLLQKLREPLMVTAKNSPDSVKRRLIGVGFCPKRRTPCHP